MRRWLSVSPVIAVAAAAALGVSFAGAQTAPPPAKPAGQCFAMRDWRGWKASPDSKALYIRTGVNEVYRLDLDFACPELQGPPDHTGPRRQRLCVQPAGPGPQRPHRAGLFLALSGQVDQPPDP